MLDFCASVSPNFVCLRMLYVREMIMLLSIYLSYRFLRCSSFKLAKLLFYILYVNSWNKLKRKLRELHVKTKKETRKLIVK